MALWRNVSFSLRRAALAQVGPQQQALGLPLPLPLSASASMTGLLNQNNTSTNNQVRRTQSGIKALDVEPDAVLLQGLTFFARHGVLLEEAALGQKFVVDLELHRCLRTAGATDDVRETVDYSQVYRAVKGIVEGPKRYKLVESIAHEIASTVLGTFGEVHGVKVRVKKPQVALMGQLDYCGVQIHRIRQTGRD